VSASSRPVPIGNEINSDLPTIWVIDEGSDTNLYTGQLADYGFHAIRQQFRAALVSLASGTGSPDLIVLELVHSEINGLALCAMIRARSTIPIVVYSRTRRAGDEDASRALGANAFVAKTGRLPELVAQIRTYVGESSAESGPAWTTSVQRVGDLVFDSANFRVRFHDIALDLTPTEYRMLVCIATGRGRVLSFEELAASVWGKAVTLGTIRHHAQKLRAMLRRALIDPPRIVSVRAKGYALRTETSSVGVPSELRGAA